MALLKVVSSLSALTMVVSACAPIAKSAQGVSIDSQAQSVSSGVGAGDVTPAQNLSCLENRVDYILSTEVTDFEMTGGGGLTAGFNPTGLILSGLSIGVTYTQGQLQTMMHLTDPLKPGVTVVNASGKASQNNLSFSLSANLTIASFGPSFWYSTTVSALSESALQSNLVSVSSQLNTLVPNDWWTTISEVNGTQGFLIPVGATAGIHVGDQFKVMDAIYDWAGDGTPCDNELIMAQVKSTTPKAIAKAQTVGIDYTYLVVTKSTSALVVHDYVAVYSLLQPTVAACTNFLGIGCPSAPAGRSPLAHSIRLGTISSKAMPYVAQGGVLQYMDISPFINDQLESLLPQQAFGGFYIHP